MVFTSMEELGFERTKQGAEARLWTGTLFGMECVAKERFPKKYRHPELDEQLTKDRLRSEARFLARARAAGILAPAVLMVDHERNVIFMEEVRGAKTVSEVLDHLSSTQELGEAVGKLIGTLHSNGIIHGDLTTSNLLIDNCDHLYVIDFGLASGSVSAEDRGVDLYVLERAVISAHTRLGDMFFAAILDGYGKSYSGAAVALAKLDEVRLRGRKRVMIG